MLINNKLAESPDTYTTLTQPPDTVTIHLFSHKKHLQYSYSLIRHIKKYIYSITLTHTEHAPYAYSLIWYMNNIITHRHTKLPIYMTYKCT